MAHRETQTGQLLQSKTENCPVFIPAKLSEYKNLNISIYNAICIVSQRY